MNVKHRPIPALLLLCALLLGLFTGCSAGKSASYDQSSVHAEAPAEAPAAPMAGESDVNYAAATVESSSADAAGVTAAQTVDLSEKIIYSASAQVETLDYEAALDGVNQLVERFGGFLESSSVSGVDYASARYGYKVTRSAEFVIRVPVENFFGLRESLSEVGNVTWLQTWSENITTQFYDTEARLTAYETEQENLTKMLLLCDSVEEMIVVEDRLSEVQYQIDSLRSTLQNWQNQVDYSTITLSIQEVAEITQAEPVVQTYWQRLGSTFMNTLENLADFFKEFFIVFLCAIPVVILPVLIIVLIVRLVRKRKRAADPNYQTPLQRRKARKAARKAAKRGGTPPTGPTPPVS